MIGTVAKVVSIPSSYGCRCRHDQKNDLHVHLGEVLSIGTLVSLKLRRQRSVQVVTDSSSSNMSSRAAALRKQTMDSLSRCAWYKYTQAKIGGTITSPRPGSSVAVVSTCFIGTEENIGILARCVPHFGWFVIYRDRWEKNSRQQLPGVSPEIPLPQVFNRERPTPRLGGATVVLIVIGRN